jgi:SAM-dependent methyltransferase
MNTPSLKPSYGVDAPKIVLRLLYIGIAHLLGGILLYHGFVYFHCPRASQSAVWIGGTGVVTTWSLVAYMLWSSKVGKFRLRDRIIHSIRWRGDETALDVGCGRGLLLIAAAKKLPTGQSIGIDIWSQEDLTANHQELTLQNARLEGVAARVEVRTASATEIPYPDGYFDVVLSMSTIHNIPSEDERAKALREMVRVLKPGGELRIFDVFRTSQYLKYLSTLGPENLFASRLILLWGVPGRIISLRK